MLVVGGGDPTQAAAADSFVTSDPFEQGLGLFDMVDLEWKTQYMENAAPYEQSGPIKAVYANGYVYHFFDTVPRLTRKTRTVLAIPPHFPNHPSKQS
jgi:hypothetical protein